MSTDFLQPGGTVEFTAPSGGVVSGTPLLIGSQVVIPTVTVAVGVRFNGKLDGVFTLPKATGATWAEGQVLYFDSSAVNFATAASATARRAGVAMAAALIGDTSGRVKLLNISAVVNVA